MDHDERKVRQLNPRLRDLIFGAVTLGVFLLFFIFSFEITEKTVSGIVSSRTIPLIISALGGGMALLLIAKNAVLYAIEQKKAKASSEGTAAKADAPATQPAAPRRWGMIAASTALLVAYIALMSTFGFIATSIAYLFVQMLILSEKKGWKRILLLLGIAAGVTMLFYLPFRYLFQLMLPVGSIFR